MFNVKTLSSDLEKNLETLLQKAIINDVSKNLMNDPKIKLGIFITTSGIKTHLFVKEILKLTEENRFFPAIATLRMMFEESILLIFVLSKMEKKKSWADAYYLLTKLNIGRKSRDYHEKEITDDKKPYNIITALKESEKYLKNTDEKLAGMLDDTYTVISDYVHPNAPSRYFFWEESGEKIKFVYRKKVGDQDLGMILNYTSMMLKIYLFSLTKLNDVKLPLTSKA